MTDMQRLLDEIEELRENNCLLNRKSAETWRLKNENEELKKKVNGLEAEVKALYEKLGEYQKRESKERHCYSH